METPEEREERRNMFISLALNATKGMIDDEIIIKEAGEKFDENNPL